MQDKCQRNEIPRDLVLYTHPKNEMVYYWGVNLRNGLKTFLTYRCFSFARTSGPALSIQNM